MDTTTHLSREKLIRYGLDHTFFSWSKQGGLDPIHIERASGVYLYDSAGKRYIDFSSQLMNVNIGHGHPAIQEAVTQQMARVSYVAPSILTDSRSLLGKELAKVTPGGLTKTFFTLGGADAIENAIKLARVYTGKHKILAHYRSYHGSTYVAMTASGDPRRHPVDVQQAPNFVHFENPYFYRCPWNTDSLQACGEMALRNLEQVIQYENPDNIAAILIEGESGTSGCIKYPPFYWQGVQKLANKYGILTIDDEIMSGFGRTGKWFGVDHHEVTPDIICMAKGLTSGYLPLGALTVGEEIAAFFDQHTLPVGLTYSAHAVCCAAALAVLEVYQKENLIDRAAKMGQYIDRRMEDLRKKHPSIGDWRNTGMLGCIEIVKNRETKEPMAPFNAKPHEMAVMSKVAGRIRELGMFTFVKWNWIFVAPPLISSEEEVDEGMEILSKAVAIADEHYQS